MEHHNWKYLSVTVKIQRMEHQGKSRKDIYLRLEKLNIFFNKSSNNETNLLKMISIEEYMPHKTCQHNTKECI